MKMQDKDFDQLFSAQLTDLEVEPSAELWGKITPEIPGNKKAASGVRILLMIAASLVVILSAGLLLIPGQQKISLQGHYNAQEAVAGVNSTNPVEQADTTNPYQTVTAQQTATQSQPKQYMAQVAQNVNKTKVATTDPIDSVQTLAVNKIESVNKPERIENPVKTNIVSTNTAATVTPKTLPVLAVNNPSQTNGAETVKKKKARGINGFLNSVIAKVDKRDDKIIQFGNDDDDADIINVTSVNLGPIKVKKQN